MGFAKKWFRAAGQRDAALGHKLSIYSIMYGKDMGLPSWATTAYQDGYLQQGSRSPPVSMAERRRLDHQRNLNSVLGTVTGRLK